jgi:hypothetical protein
VTDFFFSGMLKSMRGGWVLGLVLAGMLVAGPAAAALIDQVNEAFREVYGRTPTYSEWEYWAGRVARGEKTTYEALVGAIAYQQAQSGAVTTTAVTATVPAATSFRLEPKYYPSTLNPNFLPNGTLVRTASNPAVFYVKDGKRSWVLPKMIERWLGEAHYLASDVITTISEEDMQRYPQATSVNPLYIGKILQHPDGRQFYIDDKLRKRPMSAAVRSALRYPSRNLYPTSAAHLAEFSTGAAITRTDVHPGGTVMYNGLYHGGTVWRIEENASGGLTKRLYLTDYVYEAEGYPWSSQILSVSDAELARYARGSNVERYPDGWVVGFDGKRYLVQKGALRQILADSVFNALGLKSNYVFTVYPEFLRRYPVATPLAGFKTVTTTIAAASVPTTTTSTLSNYPAVRPAAREAMAAVNDLFLVTYDRAITADENRFWVDYVYKGEVATKEELKLAIARAKSTGVRPAITSRTAMLDPSFLRSKWFPYLFYFVWRKEPTTADREYWYSRIAPGDRDTIEKLGATIAWLKDTAGLTSR